MSPNTLQADQVILHRTFGPGRVISASPVTVEVEFHDGRRESFRTNYAKGNLLVCDNDGFSARLLADRQAVLRSLEENPREVFNWLSQDFHRDVTARTARPLLKGLNIFPSEALETAWNRATRKLHTQAPKRRIADDTPRISSEAEAREFERTLWDTEIHILSRNAIFTSLAEFYEHRSDEDFFLRALFSPVPVARAHAYGFFKKRRELGKVWEYAIRKGVDRKSAPGMLDVWFRLVDDSDSEQLRAHRERAIEIFLELQSALLKGERLDSIRKLLARQSGGAFSVGKDVVAHLPRQAWQDIMPDLSPEERRRAFQLYFQGAVYNANEAAAVEALTEFLSHFEPELVPDLMVAVAEFARTAERHAFVRRFLRRGAEVIASWSREHDSGLRRLRDWLAIHRDVLNDDLGRFFSTLGYAIDDRPAELDRAGHIRRLEDPAAPIALRERSVEVVATELSIQEVAILVQKLMAEGGNQGQRLLNTVWVRWVRQRKAPDVAEVLVGILLREHEGQGIGAWALARAEELDMSGRLADFVFQRIQSRRVGEGLDPELREVLPELRSQTVGRIVRDRLLKERARNGDRADIGASPAVRDALALLGVDPEVYAFIEHVLEDRKEQIQALTAERGHLEEKLEDILASVEIKSEIRRLVDESLGAREAQLRQEWERDLETARLEVANLYVDLATFVNSVRSSLGEDSGAIADILIRRLEQLLSSGLGLTILGRVGEAARFDPDLHQSAEGRIAEGEEVIVLRPGVRKVGPGGAVSRAVVKRA